MNFNRIVLAGRLTRDVEVRFTGKGTKVAAFGLAVNERWTGADGQKRERVMFIDCHHFGNGADVLASYCRKGSPLLLEGSLELEVWQDDGGNDHRRHSVNVENFTLCGSKPDGQPEGGR